ncbi:MAG: dihydropteroate synthase [Candidatus Omnitrophica bacterium]|nr:dihydropteroate synthase [Candidatus Omnitrophota bacterium]
MRKLNLTEPTTRQADLAFSKRTYVMGVLNVTPDSFSDGGKFLDKSKAIEHAIDMAAAGADMIDVGGVSTRPGARDVSIDEELGRVIPVLENLSKVIKIPISIDTRRSRVAEEAIRGGVSIVNDISGLRHDPAMAPVVARHGAAVIIMQMKGEPQNMQLNPAYKNLIEELIAFFRESINIARDAGVQEEKIIIDPGIGFGKTVEHNLEILNRLDEFKILGRPICIGTSRKSFIGKILDVSEPGDRLIGTLATCVIAVMKGANILRVHDVKETLQAARMTDSILKSKIKNL